MDALTVAVTGPTGEIGTAVIAALESEPRVARILGMARRPFDPVKRGWKKTEYRRGDVLDREAVDGLVAEADVVVHLAFLIMGSREESREINLDGTGNVFRATVDADRPRRLVYASSVAAYGYHPDNPTPLTEDVPTRGSPEHYYSEQKAECEALLHEVCDGSDLEAYVFRPCIVAGPHATLLLRILPQQRVADQTPAVVRRALSAVPYLDHVLPDAGVPFQLVHHDDVASALVAGVLTDTPPGAFNIAADDPVTMSDLAAALGWRSVRVPRRSANVASWFLARAPAVPADAEWLHALRDPMAMDTTRARRQLGWEPRHSARSTLAAMVAAVRADER